MFNLTNLTKLSQPNHLLAFFYRLSFIVSYCLQSKTDFDWLELWLITVILAIYVSKWILLVNTFISRV